MVESDDAPIQHVYTHPSRVEHWRHLTEIVALLMAALWGFYVFVYQERIKPASERPDVQFTLAITHVPAGHDKELVSIEPAWTNMGTVRTQIDGYIVNLYGARYSKSTPQLHEDPLLVNPPGYVQATERTRSPEAKLTLLFTYYKPWAPLGGYLRGAMAPSTSLHHVDSVVVSRGEYDTLVAFYAYCVRRSDDAFKMSFAAPTKPDGSFDTDALFDAETKAAGNKGRQCQIGGPIEYSI